MIGYQTPFRLLEDTQTKVSGFVLSQGNPTQAALIGYIAGIIDGEGTIRISKNQVKPHWNPSYHVSMSVGMIQKDIPELLTDILGGSYREERAPEGKRSIWRWNLTGRFQLIRVLEVLLPYLRVKKPQAELAITFMREWQNPKRRYHKWIVDTQEIQRREDSYWEMRKLNAVGAGATTKRDNTREGEAIVWTGRKLSEGDPKSSPRHVSGQ